uniref:Uncharacterized protein LOC117367388 isoform X2 n=1 Tax=Geotrypetes seraphini TaxID=260995 RepID=A0A6P8SC56_GEOSA|nr:uncharacterized protein LOC117367388 isoform X2 [Geotrypetes seraphini]
MVSQDLGYEDVLAFLEEAPHIELSDPDRGTKCVVGIRRGIHEKYVIASPPPTSSGAYAFSNQPGSKLQAMVDRAQPQIRPLDSSPKVQKVLRPLPVPKYNTIVRFISQALHVFPTGLKVRKLKKVLWTQHMVDLEKASQNLGYKDAFSFLLEVPNIQLKGNSCRAKIKKEDSGGSGKVFAPSKLSLPPNSQPEGSQHSLKMVQMAPVDHRNEILTLIHQSLHNTFGLQIKKLKAILWTQHTVDLEKVSQDLGYKDALDFLKETPNFQFSDPTNAKKCVVRGIKKGLNAKCIIESPQPSSAGSASISKPQETNLQGSATAHMPSPQSMHQDSSPKTSVDHTLSNTMSALSYDTVLRLVHLVLCTNLSGLKIKKLKRVLLNQHEVDLEKVSQNLGYQNAFSFLQEAPNIQLSYHVRRMNYLITIRKGVSAGSVIESPLPSSAESTSLTERQGTNLKGPATAYTSSPQSMPPDSSSKTSIDETLSNTTFSPSYETVVKLVHLVLHTNLPGLKIKRLKRVLLNQHEVDLEKVSQDLGYKNAFGFLQKAPNIQMSYRLRINNYRFKIGKGVKEGSVNMSPQLSSGSYSSSSQPINGSQGTKFQGLATARTPQPQNTHSDSSVKTSAVQIVSNTTLAPLCDAVLTLVHQILYKTCGLQVEKLKQVLLTQHKVDLEKVSQYLGYKDALSILQQTPNIQFSDPDKGTPYPKEGEVILPPYSKPDIKIKETMNPSANVPANYQGIMPNFIRFTTANTSQRAIHQPAMHQLTHYVHPMISISTHPNQHLFAKDTQVNDCSIVQLPHPAPGVWDQIPVTYPVGETQQTSSLLPLSQNNCSGTTFDNHLSRHTLNGHAPETEEIKCWADALHQGKISGEESMPKEVGEFKCEPGNKHQDVQRPTNESNNNTKQISKPSLPLSPCYPSDQLYFIRSSVTPDVPPEICTSRQLCPIGTPNQCPVGKNTHLNSIRLPVPLPVPNWIQFPVTYPTVFIRSLASTLSTSLINARDTTQESHSSNMSQVKHLGDELQDDSPKDIPQNKQPRDTSQKDHYNSVHQDTSPSDMNQESHSSNMSQVRHLSGKILQNYAEHQPQDYCPKNKQPSDTSQEDHSNGSHQDTCPSDIDQGHYCNGLSQETCLICKELENYSSDIALDNYKEMQQENYPRDKSHNNHPRDTSQEDDGSNKTQDDFRSVTYQNSFIINVTQERHSHNKSQDHHLSGISQDSYFSCKILENSSRNMIQENHTSCKTLENYPSESHPSCKALEKDLNDTTEKNHPDEKRLGHSPSNMTQESHPSCKTLDNSPSDIIQESHPIGKTLENSPSNTTKGSHPSCKTLENSPSDIIQESHPDCETLENYPGDMLKDNLSQDCHPRDVPQNNHPCDITQNDHLSGAHQNTYPSHTTQDDNVIQTNYPSGISQESHSSGVSQDNCPMDILNNDQCSKKTQDYLPGVAYQHTYSSDMAQESLSSCKALKNSPSDQTIHNYPRYTPQNYPPTETPQGNCSRYTPQENHHREMAKSSHPRNATPVNWLTDKTQDNQSKDNLRDAPQESHLTNTETMLACSDTPVMNLRNADRPTACLKEETGHVFPQQGASSTPLLPVQSASEFMEENLGNCFATQLLKSIPPPLCKEKPSNISQTTHALKHLPATNSSLSQQTRQSQEDQSLPLNKASTVQLPPVPLPIGPLVRPQCGSHLSSEPLTSTSSITKVLPLPKSFPNQPRENTPISVPRTRFRVRNPLPMPRPNFQTPYWFPKPTVWLPEGSVRVSFTSPPASLTSTDSTRLKMQKHEEPTRYNPSGELPMSNLPSTEFKEEPGPSHSSLILSAPASTSDHYLRKPQDGLPKSAVIPPKSAATAFDLKTTPGLNMIGKLLSLPEFASGIRVVKLNEILKRKYRIDLEKLRKDQGCIDMKSFLQRVPNIKLSYSGKWSTCFVKLKKALTWSPNQVTPGMIQEATSMKTNHLAPPQGPNQCPDEHHDPILKEEVLVALLQQPHGVTFGQFDGVFHKAHGYQLKLSRHGYKSLQSLLDDMKDLVEVVEKGTQDPLIRCRFPARHQLVEIFFTGPKSRIS